MNKIDTLNPLSLAYLGDSIYDVYIRSYLLEQNIVKVDELQKCSIEYVSAKNQARFLKLMLEDNILKEEEVDIVLKARNHKVRHKPKNTDIITYKYATGLEALIGWLYLRKECDRINEIIDYIKRVKK